MKNKYEVVVIGGGPAGLTASIYLKRAGHDVVVFEKYIPGGKINNTAIINNYPGIANVSGPDLAASLLEHTLSLGIKIENVEVIDVKKENDVFYLDTDEGVIETDAIIVASGTSEKKLEVLGEDKYYGLGVSYCAICDGPLYKGKDVAVIGGGNSAFEEAIYLSSLCNKVYIIHRSEKFRSDEILIEEAKKKDNIELILNSVVHEIKGDKVVTSLVIKRDDELIEIPVSAIFPFIGIIPNTSFLKSLHILNEQSYVIVNSKLSSAVEGLFAAGDVIDKDLRQIVTATGDGAIAATSASRYLKRRH